MSRLKEKKSDGKPLGDIAGLYMYNQSKLEFKPLKTNLLANEKKVYSIRLGYSKDVVFVNHADYLVCKTDYTTNIYEKEIIFDYNNSKYCISTDYKYSNKLDTYITTIEKIQK